ncbi:MAG: twin-arginine translocase subunit TatC [Coriobacteriaceae bacterium]|uniref:twin-arginine translocase subunit TatC n=1 Tax=Tractidigestivibacter sp. TaxID=2847320 RepID=UPI002A7EB1D5|nr:twin-arginine translocase subunit TatC [Tractidigestivibacter sp.]MCI6273451.1 twin-arginine translocase subunit TatC [Coriobacteriaceae bacterium]MCI6547370.1 twin-arginine translocase subunit TatC [Coriobacteriaceae bacterium]MCI6844746.1 twin-arginine translocase subunit TatC [Coriobacteriaceae bacterium]MCI7438871.1 twin-arginine translocase subunit TatC [Coriobacteriaceae bacterium]MDD7585203.1 twin-arginine translocase subunit TatC [Coriobacteriaceae bacterium]
MPIGPARMPIMDHLGELRRRITIIVVSLLTVAVIVYFATPTLIDLMIDRIEEAMRGGDLYVLTALGGFTIRFKVAMFFAAIICTPIIIWEILAFILPALRPNERRWVIPTVAALVALFYIGMIFCYYVIQPAAFGWLLDQSFEFAQSMPDAEDYLSIYMLLEIGFGIAFELPLVIFYLSILHIVPYKTFRSQWRYIYIGLMILSAVVTPDASPVTMLLMFAALIGLYEIALAIARYVIMARDGRQALKWSREDYENAELDKL